MLYKGSNPIGRAIYSKTPIAPRVIGVLLFWATALLTQRFLQLLHYLLVFAINSTYYVFTSIAVLPLCPQPPTFITKMRAH